jgi:hypothetical protein
MAQERILACKSFANIKLFEAQGKDLDEYLTNFTEIAAANDIALNEKETDVFRFVIYSKLNDNVRNWLGDRFFSITNVKSLISALLEYGNASLETYQIHCPACLSSGKFNCPSVSCAKALPDLGNHNTTTPIVADQHHQKIMPPQVPAFAQKNTNSPKHFENPTVDSNRLESAPSELKKTIVKVSELQTQSSERQTHTFDPRRQQPSEDTLKKSSIVVSENHVNSLFEEEPLEDEDKALQEFDLFNSTYRNASEILQAAGIGKCFDCNQSWTIGHSCPGRRKDLQALKCMDCKLPQKPGHICPIMRVREGAEFFRQELAYEMMISAMVYECFDCKKTLENHACKSSAVISKS